MAKLFCFSDCHGFYNELKQALDEAGFDENNETHWLIGCGDYFDRGRQPQEIIDYLMSLDRCVLVKGNHIELLEDMLKRGYPQAHDYSNGTFNTVLDLAPFRCSVEENFNIAYGKTYNIRNKMVDYFETENYVFVHSSIPAICCDDLPKHYTKNRVFKYDKDWRNATEDAWSAARWGNPFNMVETGILPENKTLVFGHWHTSYMWAKTEGRSEFGDDAKFDPYFGDGFIGLDGCTAHTGKVNVIVLEDNFLE